MGSRVHQVVAAAHRSEITGSQLVQREVDGAAPAVARLGGHVPPFEHLRPVDVRVVPSFRAAVLRLSRPAQEEVDGALRTVAAPQEQAEAQGCGFFLGSVQGGAQGPGADDTVGVVAVHRLAGEVVPGGVLGIPPYAGDELVDEDEVAVHRAAPYRVSVTSRSMTSASGRPAAAIILG